MELSTFTSSRAMCPGCGAPLGLASNQAIVTCNYCGCDSKVIRHLRKIEPDFLPPVKPEKKGNPEKDYDYWNAEQLVNGILNESDLKKRILMAKALDEWPHADYETAALVPVIVEIMLKAEPELDNALSGILGKLICHDDVKLKRQVIMAGEKYGFNVKGSKGLLFALSLGDEGTVKLLLDIAEYASVQEGAEYAEAALIGVQTATGRISAREELKIAMEILLYRLPYVTGIVQEWAMRFLRNHFDVGYTFLYSSVLEIMEDCVYEAPHLTEGFKEALLKCRRADNREEFLERLETIRKLRTDEALAIACETLGSGPGDLAMEDVTLAVQVLSPLFRNPQVRESAGKALKDFLWYGNNIPEPLRFLCEEQRDLPESLKYYYELRKGR